MARVLVVDDAEYMIRLIGVMLKKLNHEVVGEATNGPKAIELYEKLHPDLVIMDVLMPHVDGIATLRKIRAADPNARVIMCSASEQAHHINEATASGASGYIVKPFSVDELNEAVQMVF